MTSHNFATLRDVVLGASRSKTWAEAVHEWLVVGVEQDPRATGICVCGKTGLIHLFTIHNRITAQALVPIGSSCVNMFEVEDLNITVAVLQRLSSLRNAYVTGRRVELTREYFSRSLLADLWQEGAFPPNQFNRMNGENDYKFLLDLFNRRSEASDNEGRKVWVLLNRTIREFLLADARLA